MVSSHQILANPTHQQPHFGISPTSALASESLGSLRQQLPTLLKDGYPSIAQVARVAGTSTRSLQRQLAKADLTYTLVVEQVRYETAMRLLQDHRHKLIDIAFDLGYADPASFSKAFKRWTGISPREFRRFHTQFSMNFNGMN